MVGNISKFTKTDILWSLMLIKEETSRSALSKATKMGEGTLRSILDILKQKRLIRSTQRGHTPTKKGRLLQDYFEDRICLSPISDKRMYPELRKIGLLIRSKNDLKFSVALRDEGIKNGADAIVIFKEKKGALIMPTIDKHHHSRYKGFIERLRDTFRPNPPDLLVLSCAKNHYLANHAAFAIAQSIDKRLRL